MDLKVSELNWTLPLLLGLESLCNERMNKIIEEPYQKIPCLWSNLFQRYSFIRSCIDSWFNTETLIYSRYKFLFISNIFKCYVQKFRQYFCKKCNVLFY